MVKNNIHVRERPWFVRLYREIIPELKLGDYLCTGAQTMLYLTCTTITSVDLAHYGVFLAKDGVSVDCGTGTFDDMEVFLQGFYSSKTLKMCSCC